jgi:glutamine amidotransferase
MIAVVDYGIGNLPSVARALARAGAAEVRVTREANEILSARGVVLPGVGHFGDCSRALHRLELDVPLRRARAEGLPILGLCVGMQLFFESSEEDASAPGLGFYCGTVRRLAGAVRVPHTGWNAVRLRRAHPWLAEVPDGAHFYFVHSFAAAPEDDVVLGTTDHGGEIVAIVGGEGLLGVQFHPEKSSRMGERLLAGFVRAAQGTSRTKSKRAATGGPADSMRTTSSGRKIESEEFRARPGR